MTVEEPGIEPEEDTMDDVNRRLSDAILSLLDDERTLFKMASGKFRTGLMTAEEYVSYGCEIMGNDAFLTLLPDLCRTLPEGKHKRALEKVANQQ